MPQLLGKEVGVTGYGLMGLTWRANPQSDEESFKAMKAALEAGCNFWNAGEFYGTPENNSLHLLNKYFTKYPEDAERVVLSVKGCISAETLAPDGSPEIVKKSVENCLELLDGKKKIDIFEPARVDPNVPIEVTLKALEEFVKAGKIGGLSLSECSAATIHRAVKVTKIVGCEVELSLFALDTLQNGVAEALAQYDIPLIAYSPLGRGFLTGEIKKIDDIPENDWRRGAPRFQGENFEKNLDLIQKLEAIAAKKTCSPAQLAMSWVRHISKKNGNPEIIPIPGATNVDRVLENAKDIPITEEDESAIDLILKSFEPAGARYGEHAAKYCEG